MSETDESLVESGNYVIVQKQSFRKLCKVTENGILTLGKEQVEINGLIGRRYWTTFQMVQSRNKRKTLSLEVATKAESSEELRKDLSSGRDNRSITDDGTSQKLSKEEIESLRDSGKSSNEILGQLIENSKSFAAKTEYSQEKYIKKKERKYYRYLTIRKPSIDLLQEIYFKQDYARISCLRIDTLAQILSYCDVKAEGTYMLYDSGSMGLPASAMLNRIGCNTDGVIIHLHPGNQAQTTLVQAMNYPPEQLERLLAVNLYSFLRLQHQGEAAIMEEIAWKSSLPLSDSTKNGNIQKKANNEKKLEKITGEELEKIVGEEKAEILKEEIKEIAGKSSLPNSKKGTEVELKSTEILVKIDSNSSLCTSESTDSKNIDAKPEKTTEKDGEENATKIADRRKNGDTDSAVESEAKMETEEVADIEEEKEEEKLNSLKRKRSDEEKPATEAKRPKWLLETRKAVDHCKQAKVQGLVIIAREHPLNIVTALFPFLGASRPFVIYHCYREPLQDTYVALKQRRDIVNLKLLTNFTRSYQILPNRTHPDIMTSDLGGYLLTGYRVE